MEFADIGEIHGLLNQLANSLDRVTQENHWIESLERVS